MGYRGEDASRAQADRGRPSPWHDNGQPEHGQPEHGQPEYGQYDDYGPAGGYGDPAGYTDPAGYGQHEDYGYQQGGDQPVGYGQAPGYQQPGYGQPGYGQLGYEPRQPATGYDQGYGAPGGYQRPDGGGYGPPPGHPDTGYPDSGHPDTGYPDSGYPDTGYPDAGYPAGGGYQGDGRQGQDAGNDWYGGQPAAASGASFADTGAYRLNGRIADEYGTGPQRAQRDPVRGYPPTTGPLAPAYPPQPQPQPEGRPFPAPLPPASSGPMATPRTGPLTAPRTGPMATPRTGPQPARRTGPQSGPFTGPQSIPHTGQQIRYDGVDPRTAPGGRGYDDFDTQGGYAGPGAYGAPAGYGQPSGYTGPGDYGGEPAGYDAYGDPAGLDVAPAGAPATGYADYLPDADPHQDQGDPAGRGSRGSRGSRGKKAGRGAKSAAKAPAAKARARAKTGSPGGTGSAGQPGSGRPWPQRPLLLAVVAVVVVIIIGVVAYVSLFKPQSPASRSATAGPLPTSGSAPSAQACVKQFGTYCHIEVSTDDPAALTVSELFPPAFTNTADKSSFSLVSDKLDKTCSKAVIGADLITALKAGKCTQVVRASYVSGDGKMMGTIGVVNLDTTNEAHYAGKVVGQSDFIAPLAAAKGVAKKLGQGTGVVEAEFKGHYLILTWSEFTNGTSPSTKAQDTELEQFSSDLVAGTANISLSQRMVTGVPAVSGAPS